MAERDVIRKLRRHGVKQPRAVIEEAQRAGLSLSNALAMLEKETGIPQRNIFGGDYGAAYAGKPPYYHDRVTRRRVKKLLGQPLNNGVGWCQLTYRPFVTQAEAMGGAHKPRFQMRVGFGVLGGLIRQKGQAAGFAAYNGSGPAAEAYGRDAVAKAERWKSILR